MTPQQTPQERRRTGRALQPERNGLASGGELAADKAVVARHLTAIARCATCQQQR